MNLKFHVFNNIGVQEPTRNLSATNILRCNLETRACNPLWRLAEALGNTSESQALVGCFQVLIIIQTVGLFSDSNIV
jgi:hypothetical protein